MSDSPVFAPARLGPITLRNHVVKAATFEGVTPKGLVTDELVEYHLRVARGGVGMTTVAYCAVSPGGRTHRQVLVLSPESLPGLRRLTDAVHAEGAAVSAQIGHAGLVANARSNRAPTVAPSPRFSPAAMGRVRGATPTDLQQVRQDYVSAARIAVAAGFDALEIHLGHQYLLSSFLSPNLNKRKDAYGGSLANRARFPREVVQAVRDAAGTDVAVYAKLNMTDGVRGGLQVEESIEVAKLLEADGALDALMLTGGSSLANPMYLFRGDVPRAEFAATQPLVPRLGLKVVGPWFLRAYPFEEAFCRAEALNCRAALDMPLVLLGGINRLDTMEQALADGFQLVAMARALLREPDLLNKMQAGASQEALCIHCNRCMPTIYSGTRCVLVVDGADA